MAPYCLGGRAEWPAGLTEPGTQPSAAGRRAAASKVVRALGRSEPAVLCGVRAAGHGLELAGVRLPQRRADTCTRKAKPYLEASEGRFREKGVVSSTGRRRMMQ